MSVQNSAHEDERFSLRSLADFLGAIALCNGVGISSGLLSGGAGSDWYRALEKPSFNPPGWVFGPAWTVLYTLMGGSLAILWRARGKNEAANPALVLFGVQLALNALWSFLFFRWKSPGWALVEICVLFVAIVLTIRAAWRVSPVAGGLLIPYLAWVGFATVLNGSIWWLNRE